MSKDKENKFGTFLKEILTGDIFSKQFFARQIGVIIWGILLAFFYMNNRMVCEQSYKEIHELRKELANEKYICMVTEAELLKNSRIEQVKEIIKKISCVGKSVILSTSKSENKVNNNEYIYMLIIFYYPQN